MPGGGVVRGSDAGVPRGLNVVPAPVAARFFCWTCVIAAMVVFGLSWIGSTMRYPATSSEIQ